MTATDNTTITSDSAAANNVTYSQESNEKWSTEAAVLELQLYLLCLCVPDDFHCFVSHHHTLAKAEEHSIEQKEVHAFAENSLTPKTHYKEMYHLCLCYILRCKLSSC